VPYRRERCSAGKKSKFGKKKEQRDREKEEVRNEEQESAEESNKPLRSRWRRICPLGRHRWRMRSSRAGS
jgi:hypothetical protein